MGVMDVTGSVQHIEHLPGLSHRAEEGIVATLSLLLAVKPHRRALGETPRTDHRAIEVQRHPWECQGRQSCEDPVPKRPLQAPDTLLVRPRQRTAHGGDIRQPAQPKRSLDQRVIGIIADIAQLSVSKQQVHDQTQYQGGIAEDGADREMAKTAPQPLLQSQTDEELLDENEPRIRGQLAVLKSKHRKAVSLAVNFGSATLHRSGLLRGCCCFGKHIIPQSVGRFF